MLDGLVQTSCTTSLGETSMRKCWKDHGAEWNFSHPNWTQVIPRYLFVLAHVAFYKTRSVPPCSRMWPPTGQGQFPLVQECYVRWSYRNKPILELSNCNLGPSSVSKVALRVTVPYSESLLPWASTSSWGMDSRFCLHALPHTVHTRYCMIAFMLASIEVDGDGCLFGGYLAPAGLLIHIQNGLFLCPSPRILQTFVLEIPNTEHCNM
jgi:hypothetical protein